MDISTENLWIWIWIWMNNFISTASLVLSFMANKNELINERNREMSRKAYGGKYMPMEPME